MNMWLSLEAHTHFWQKTISGASFFSSYYTTIPTFIFLVSSFCSIYQYVNKTRRNTGWKSTVVRVKVTLLLIESYLLRKFPELKISMDFF